MQTVASLGDSRRVITNQAIFASNGIKLVDTGVRFNSAFFDRLVRHKLLPPLDQCLDVEDGVTHDLLRDHALELLNNDASPCFAAFRSEADTSEKILGAIHSITLTAPLAFKLTVALEQRREVFDRSLRIAIISVYLAIKESLPVHDLTTVATAALFHDLGLLHIDPTLMTPGRKLGKSERYHLYSHPITAFLILRECPEYHPDVSNPVYEHHERLDGSGYPHGLKEGEISLCAQILLLAEIASSFLASEQHRAKHLPVMLKLNQHKINRQLSGHLITMLASIPNDPLETKPATPIPLLESQRKVLAEVFKDWHSTYAHCKKNPNSPKHLSFLNLFDDRFQSLYRNLLATGIPTFAQQPTLDEYKDDAGVLEEIEFTVQEALWQVTDITHEAQRRSQEFEQEGGKVPPEIKHWLMRAELLLQEN